MAIPVFIMGRSGSGKTYSLKGFNNCPERVGVISVEKGRLPFKTTIKTTRIPKFEQDPKFNSSAKVSVARYSWIEQIIRAAKAKSIVIDDSQYLLVNQLFDGLYESNQFDLYKKIAYNFRNLIHYINQRVPDDVIVYFLHHSETDQDGREKVKTIGKMLDEKLTIEGCFDIVLYCADQKFYTQGNGISTAKTPEGMFNDKEIPNDLKAVDAAIREYWGL